MSDQEIPERPSRVATPAYLPQRLLSFRLGKGDTQTYVLRDKVKGKNYDLEPWQFFVLEVLPGCTDEATLQGVFEDRFARRLERQELDDFLASLSDATLLNEAAESHPLLSRFFRKTYVVDGERATAVPQAAVVAAQAQAASASRKTPTAAASAVTPARPAGHIDPDETLPAGVQDALDFDPRAGKWMWVWFNPTLLLKLVTPLLVPLRHLMVVLPLLLFGALMLIARNMDAMQQELTLMFESVDLIEHWIISLVTVNLATTCLTAVLAHKFRATVSGFGIVLLLRFYPRFGTRIGHLDQLSRVERMWLHGAPMLLRTFLFCLGIYLWFGSRGSSLLVPTFALALSTTAAVSLLFTINPLIKSNGYHLLSAFTNEPHLRGKAFKTLLNKVRGRGFKEANELLLATYGIAMAVFLFVLVVGATVVVLRRLDLGGSTIIIACIIGFVLLRQVLNYFSRVEAAYDRSLQFDRWRKRTLHDQKGGDTNAKASRGFASYVWKAGLITLVVVMFLPYDYRAGGSFVVYPKLQQVISTDISGRVDEVFFDGGETISKGMVVARLATNEDEAQAIILEKKMAEQQAVIDDFGSYPRAEDIKVAKTALSVAQTRVKFSEIELKRIKSLADDAIVPLEELDEVRRKLSVDRRQLEEKKAELAVAKLGATDFKVAEAHAKWESLAAQRDAYLDRIRRAELLMPFDGRLLTLHLLHKGNGYYKSGEAFADVEASGPMTAEIELPESEMEHVRVGSTVQLKPVAYSAETFPATVVHIDWNVTEQKFGNVVKVLAVIEDESGRLRNGMTGYAKVDGPSLLVWEAFSKEIVRFFEVQVWSWIP